MVEGGGLENRKARKGLGGSNPSSSANSQSRAVEIKIHEIDPVADRKCDGGGLLAQGPATSPSFWISLALEELAHLQDVQPLADVQVLYGTWPGDLGDGFEAAIDDLRHPVTLGRGR